MLKYWFDGFMKRYLLTIFSYLKKMKKEIICQRLFSIKDMQLDSIFFSWFVSIHYWRSWSWLNDFSVVIVAMYIIFFTVFVNPQAETVTILDISPWLFNQLRSDHGETLSCPCSTTFIAYENFVLNNLSIDPLCSSIFVSEQWIQSLYVPVASSFLMMDFRTTAYSQVSSIALSSG